MNPDETKVTEQVNILSVDYLIPLQEQMQRLYSEGVLAITDAYVQVTPNIFGTIVPPEAEVVARRNGNSYELRCELQKNGKTILILALI